MGYKMNGPSLLKMVSALKNKEKEHFLMKDPVGPIATKKPFDPESYFVDKDLDDAMHRKHAEKTYKEDHPDPKPINTEFTQSGSPVIPAPEEKVLDANSYIMSKQTKSKKKKY